VLLFFLNGPATTEIYTLSLHDALPILAPGLAFDQLRKLAGVLVLVVSQVELLGGRGGDQCLGQLPLLGTYGALFNLRREGGRLRSEEHTSELQSRFDLVCRLLLEKKNC